MHMQGAAADLLLTGPDIAAIGLQHPAAGVMYIRLKEIHDTAGEKANAVGDRRLTFDDIGYAVRKGARRELRCHGFHLAELIR